MRVMIVEDQVMIRGLLETYFTKENGDQIVASIPGAGQAVELCRTGQVDLILMDVQTQHRENGLTAVREIKARYPKIRIIIVTSLVDGAVLDEAKAAGADSLWYKDHGQEEIMEVIDRTLEGKHVFPDKAPAVELKWMKSDEISPRQLEMLRLYIKGYSYSEIGKQMNCSAAGVRWNFQDMIAKAGYSCKEELLAAVLESKLVVSTLKDWQTL